jgi:hypothetical protein
VSAPADLIFQTNRSTLGREGLIPGAGYGTTCARPENS